jgi:hypothetical protein
LKIQDFASGEDACSYEVPSHLTNVQKKSLQRKPARTSEEEWDARRSGAAPRNEVQGTGASPSLRPPTLFDTRQISTERKRRSIPLGQLAASATNVEIPIPTEASSGNGRSNPDSNNSTEVQVFPDYSSFTDGSTRPDLALMTDLPMSLSNSPSQTKEKPITTHDLKACQRLDNNVSPMPDHTPLASHDLRSCQRLDDNVSPTPDHTPLALHDLRSCQRLDDIASPASDLATDRALEAPNLLSITNQNHSLAASKMPPALDKFVTPQVNGISAVPIDVTSLAPPPNDPLPNVTKKKRAKLKAKAKAKKTAIQAQKTARFVRRCIMRKSILSIILGRQLAGPVVDLIKLIAAGKSVGDIKGGLTVSHIPCQSQSSTTLMRV